MKIIVAIKQIPARDSQLKAVGAWIDEEDLTFEINEPDAYALEEALQLKEKHGGEVIALCVGPERAGSTIREALAKGAEAAIETESPDLVLTGLQSDDLGYGQAGVVLAELLGYPHATIIMQVEKLDGALRVKRELEDGWFQYLTMPLPAVLAIQSGINKLRYATLMGIKKAKLKEVKPFTPVAAAATARIERVYAPSRSKQTVMLEGAAKEQAAKLVEKLKFETRVI
jgi:electron transfer flavoprotein beta subunit